MKDVPSPTARSRRPAATHPSVASLRRLAAATQPPGNLPGIHSAIAATCFAELASAADGVAVPDLLPMIVVAAVGAPLPLPCERCAEAARAAGFGGTLVGHGPRRAMVEHAVRSGHLRCLAALARLGAAAMRHAVSPFPPAKRSSLAMALACAGDPFPVVEALVLLGEPVDGPLGAAPRAAPRGAATASGATALHAAAERRDGGRLFRRLVERLGADPLKVDATGVCAAQRLASTRSAPLLSAAIEAAL